MQKHIRNKFWTDYWSYAHSEIMQKLVEATSNKSQHIIEGATVTALATVLSGRQLSTTAFAI